MILLTVMRNLTLVEFGYPTLNVARTHSIMKVLMATGVEKAENCVDGMEVCGDVLDEHNTQMYEKL